MSRQVPRLDALFADLMRAGESEAAIRGFVSRPDLDETSLVGLLRRPVPVRFLDHVGTTLPWADRPRILAGVVLNSKTPRTLALRLLPALFWRDVAEAASSPRVHPAVRVRAEELLRDKLPEMRLGEKVTLAKIATPPLLKLLFAEPEPKVLRAILRNPRLKEEDLLNALRGESVPVALLESVAASARWGESYAVRLALVLQTRTPLSVALAQISSLLETDLLRVAGTPGLRPLLQAAALRVACRSARPGEGSPPEG